MRGVRAQLGQVRQVDVVFGARSRSHYGLKMLSLDCWNSFDVREGWTRRWLVPAKEDVVAQRKPVQGAFKQETPLGPSPSMRIVQITCAFYSVAANSALSRVFGGSRFAGARICGGPEDLEVPHNVSRSGERGLGRRRVPKGVSCSASWSQ